jgi:hypothetical protein
LIKPSRIGFQPDPTEERWNHGLRAFLGWHNNRRGRAHNDWLARRRGQQCFGERRAIPKDDNPTGDSDSTRAICGNLVGTRDGVFAIPPTFLRELEAREILVQLADDFALESTDPPSEDGWGGASEAWFERYPGW